MKKSNKIILILAAILFITGLAFSVTGMIKGASPMAMLYDGKLSVSLPEDNVNAFEESNRYALPASGINHIDISWISGTVSVIPYEGKEIILEESSTEKITEDEGLKFTLEEGELEISSKRKITLVPFRSNLIHKDLVVKVPYALNEISVDTVSGDFYLEGVSADHVEFDSVSGNFRGEFKVMPEKMEIETVSGDGTVYLPEEAEFRASLSCLSGKITSDLPGTLSDKYFISGDGTGKIEMDSVSGNLNLEVLK